MAGRQAVKISAVALEKGGVWFVQGIEHDICTHAKSAGEVPARFARAVAENLCINEHLGRTALEGIKPAPAEYKELFDHATASLSPVGDLPQGRLPGFPDVDIRVA